MSVSVSNLVVSVATPADAAGMVEVIHAAFSARPPLDPPSTAIDETVESVSAALARGGGIYATADGQPAGVILIERSQPGVVSFRRVSVHPHYQRHGIASTMVRAAQDLAAELGATRAELFARTEFAELIEFWRHRQFRPVREQGPHGIILGAGLPLALTVPTATDMQDLGVRLARLLQPGDLVIASGELGAGKTTLTQGVGRGLGAAGTVISPTFVLSRIHHSTSGGPDLVHVDAYRLTGPEELDDLDLDSSLERSVTLVEWGEGLAEHLAPARLEIDIRRAQAAAAGDGAADPRSVWIRAVGERWRGVDLAALQPTRAAAAPPRTAGVAHG